jgi:hypothetical protein
MKRYETFAPDVSVIRVGAELALVLRDLTPGRARYAARHARVRLLAPDEPEADGELQVRSRVGQAIPGIWRFRVLEPLPDLIPAAPYTDAYEALGRLAGG